MDTGSALSADGSFGRKGDSGPAAGVGIEQVDEMLQAKVDLDLNPVWEFFDCILDGPGGSGKVTKQSEVDKT